MEDILKTIILDTAGSNCKNFTDCFMRFSLEQSTDAERKIILILRLIALILLVILLTIHVKSLRVFRWEQSVSGGVLVTYVVAVAGLVLCAGINRCGGQSFQTYLCATGAALLFANCAAIWSRWHSATEMTHAMAELLSSLGVPLRRQVLSKVCLSAAAATCLALDLALVPIFAYYKGDPEA